MRLEKRIGESGIDHGDFGHGVGDDTPFRNHGDALIGEDGNAIPSDMRTMGSALHLPPIMEVGGTCNGAVRDSHHMAYGLVGIAELDLPIALAKCSQITTRIDQSGGNAGRHQRFNRAVHRMTFRDTAKIDQRPSMTTDVSIVDYLDIRRGSGEAIEMQDSVAGQKAATDECPPDRDVEQTVGRFVQCDSHSQDRNGLAIDHDDLAGLSGTKSCQVTSWFMKGHARVNLGHHGKGRADRILVSFQNRDFHQRAEQGSATCDHRQAAASTSEWMASRRFTPSVMLRQESVAPEMFGIS